MFFIAKFTESIISYLSEIEKQFQNLTNKFEEINFKVDKLSSRMSKTQADNQLRFQDLENNSKLVQKSDNNQELSTKRYKNVCQKNNKMDNLKKFDSDKLRSRYFANNDTLIIFKKTSTNLIDLIIHKY